MKQLTRIAMLPLAGLLCLLVAAPVWADTLYDNGPINGTIRSWTIDLGYQVSDTFTLGSQANLTSFQLGLWVSPGDENVETVDWAIGTSPGDNSLGSGTSALVDTLQTTISPNSYGYDLIESVGTFAGLTNPLGAGTYWLSIENATVASGNPVGWDINNGPSQAWESVYGYLGGSGGCGSVEESGSCSESFQIYGNTTSTPEPGALMLLGAGLLGLLGARRKLRHT